MNKITRRRFIAATAATAGVTGLAAGVVWWQRRDAGHADHAAHIEPPSVRDPTFPNPLRLLGADGMLGVVDATAPLTIVAKTVRHPLLPGKPASILAYEIEQDGKRFLNPVLKTRPGATFRARFWNALDETSIIHWHGLKVESNNDGHPHYAVAGGEIYDYQYEVANRAGTYWYHPHPHGLTGKQVYSGLAGLFIVEDDEEIALRQALDLAFGVSDIPLIIQDKRISEDGRLIYSPTEQEQFHGFLGDQVLVNLTPRPHFEAATRIYRFRILNGSNTRIYRLAFTHGEQALDFVLIGSDGGLLDRPYTVKELFLSPAERADVLLDLRREAVGDAIMLKSLAFDPMHAESDGGMAMDHGAISGQGQSQSPSPHAGMAMGGQAQGAPAPAASPHGAMLADGAAIDLLRINVTSKTAYEPRVPATLSVLAPVKAADVKPREFLLDLKDGLWRINGNVFEMMKTPVVVKRGASEIWEIRNAERSMPHPMHLHGFLFRVLARSGSPEQLKGGVVNEQGLTATDLGWKDTVLVWPGETVRVAVDFSHPFPGDQVYLFHCHNLEHGDGGMMLNLKVAG